MLDTAAANWNRAKDVKVVSAVEVQTRILKE